MKKLVTRYTCDAPDCEDTAEIAAPPDTGMVQRLDTPSTLPDGWIELQVTGSSPGGVQDLVHASKPECAAALAEDQVKRAVEVAEQREKEDEEARERAEKATKEASEAAADQRVEGESGDSEP